MIEDLKTEKRPDGGYSVTYSGFVNGFEYPYTVTFHFDTARAATEFTEAFDSGVRGVVVMPTEQKTG